MHVVDEIAACMKDSARALVAVSRLKTRDEHTFLHSVAVTALMVHLGRSIKADENTIKVLGMGGLLHDVGKVKTPLGILNKASRLTDPEMALVRQHPVQGYELLSRQGDIPEASSRETGRKGVPQRLVGRRDHSASSYRIYL